MITEKLRVIIESVTPLSDKQQTRLADAIKRVLFPKKIVCYFTLNPYLLAGIKVHLGSMILDDSRIKELDKRLTLVNKNIFH